MTEHYTTNTESATKWCNRCSSFTQHAVSDGRLGRCLNDHAAVPPDVQRQAEASFRSGECLCGQPKRPAFPFCLDCWVTLPPELRHTLFNSYPRRDIVAYARAWEQSAARLRTRPPRRATNRSAPESGLLFPPQKQEPQ